MAELIRIERWSRPWEPAKDARLVETLNYYDMPLSGIIEQGGDRYLFMCLAGQMGTTHLWAYRALANQDLSRLEGADGPEALGTVMEELLEQGPLTIAVASEEEGVFGAAEAPTTERAALEVAVDRIVEELDEYLERSKSRTVEIKRLVGSAAS